MSANLFVLDAVKQKYEDSLQTVDDGEQVGHDEGLLTQVEQPERPGQSEQENQYESSSNPDSARKIAIIRPGPHTLGNKTYTTTT